MPLRTTWSRQNRAPAAKLLKDNDPRNLVRFLRLSHTRFTYHRTWETGLGAEIRVTVANPAFFCTCLNQQQVSRIPSQQSFPSLKNPLESIGTGFHESLKES